MRLSLVLLVALFSLPALAQGVTPEASGEIYEVVQQRPEMIGGLEGLMRRVEYPEMARRAGVEGKVFVQFVVDEAGDVQDARAVICPYELLCDAAVRAVRETRFRPGMQDGAAVKVRFTLPVDFKLRDPDEVDDGASAGNQRNIERTPPMPPEPPAEPATGPSYALPLLLGQPWSEAGVEGVVGRALSGRVKGGTGTLVYADPNPSIDRVILHVARGRLQAVEVEYVGAESVAQMRAAREDLIRRVGPPAESGAFSPEQLGEPRRLTLLPEAKRARIEYAPLAGDDESGQVSEPRRGPLPTTTHPTPPPLPEPESPEVYEVVETPPVLIGGIEGLQRRVRYPEKARRDGIEGIVFVQLVVDEKGRATDIACLRSPDRLLCDAAVAAVAASRFEPGRQRGEAVKVRFTIPISFRLR